MLEGLPDHLMAVDAEGRIRYINHTVADLSSDEVIGKQFWDFLPDEYRKAARDGLEQAATSREPVTYEVMYRTKSGEEQWFEAHVAPAVVDGGVAGFSIRSTDITRHREAMDRLRSSEHRHRQLAQAVTHSPAAVMITDKKGEIEYVNPKFVQLTGYLAAEVIGRNPSLLNSGVQPADFYKELWRTIRGGGVWRGEFCNRRKSGENYWVSASISPVRGDDGAIAHFVSVNEDITEQRRTAERLKRAYAEIRASHEQLEQTEHLRDELVHMIVHDMRSLLLVMRLSVSMLTGPRAADISEEHRQRVLQRLDSVVDELIEMAGAQLDVSRLEAGQMPLDMAEHDVAGIAAETIDSLGAACEDLGIRLRVDCHKCKAVCDAKVVRRVITNLLTNAIRHADEGDGIQVSVSSGPDGVRVAVADDGPGIPEELRGKIFEKFGQAEERDKFGKEYSSGLGLTFCRMAVEAHGGDIGVESEVGKGSTFWFSLPAGKRA